MKRLFAVIGHPVSQSLSPAMHNAAFRELGLPFRYEAHEVKAGTLRRAMSELRQTYDGFNVTMPLKHEAAALMNRLHGDAAICHSVNTVVCSGAVDGHSTDGEGLVAALGNTGADVASATAIIGTGGAAASAAAALLRHGASVTVAGRNWNAGTILAHRLRNSIDDADIRFVHLRERRDATLARIVERVSVLINATPLGDRRHAGQSPIPEQLVFPTGIVVCDLVSVPESSPLIQTAMRRGCRTVTGVDVLVEQGMRSFHIWTGIEAPRSVMSAAARSVTRDQAPVTVQ